MRAIVIGGLIGFWFGVLVAAATGCESVESGGGSFRTSGTNNVAEDGSQTIGAVTAIDVTRVASTESPVFATAPCFGPDVLIGGGCECKDHPLAAGRLKAQIPLGNAMHCECVNKTGTPENHPAIAYALCMHAEFTQTAAP